MSEQSGTIGHRTFHHIVNLNMSMIDTLIQKYTQIFTVEEKIDGSNFYFACDGSTVIRGKRNCTITDDITFYGASDTNLVKLKPCMMQLYQRLSINNAILYLYGELIPTQKRIQYIVNGDPNSYFIAYDLRLVPKGGDQEATWVPKIQWYDHAIQSGFMVVPTLFTGTLQQCIQFDVDNAKSCIPRLINPNTQLQSPIEGIVIKSPVCVFKKKSANFSEIETNIVLKRAVREKCERNNRAIQLLTTMLTNNRIDNVISHIGNDMVPDPIRLSNAVVRDAIQEAQDDPTSVIHQVSRHKLSDIKKQLIEIFAETVKEYMGW